MAFPLSRRWRAERAELKKSIESKGLIIDPKVEIYPGIKRLKSINGLLEAGFKPHEAKLLMMTEKPGDLKKIAIRKLLNEPQVPPGLRKIFKETKSSIIKKEKKLMKTQKQIENNLSPQKRQKLQKNVRELEVDIRKEREILGTILVKFDPKYIP